MLKCVKVGEKCLIGEGLTPATSDVEKVILLGCKTKFVAKYGVSMVMRNRVKKVVRCHIRWA